MAASPVSTAGLPEVAAPRVARARAVERALAVRCGWYGARTHAKALEARAFAPDHAPCNRGISAGLGDRQNRQSGTRSECVQDLLLHHAPARNPDRPRCSADCDCARLCRRVCALVDLWGRVTHASCFDPLDLWTADEPLGAGSSAVVLGGYPHPCLHACPVPAAGAGSAPVDRCRTREAMNSPLTGIRACVFDAYGTLFD